MGLDISAWSKAERAEACPACGHLTGAHDLRVGTDPSSFPERAAPFAPGDGLVVGDCEAHMRFGYSGWGFFRSLLCEAANGEPADHDHQAFWQREERADAVLWDLINFTDCDGILGPVACERIHRELLETREKFLAVLARPREVRSDWTDGAVGRYDELTALFAVAAHGGVVRFG